MAFFEVFFTEYTLYMYTFNIQHYRTKNTKRKASQQEVVSQWQCCSAVEGHQQTSSAQSSSTALQGHYKQRYHKVFWKTRNRSEVQEGQFGHPVMSQRVYGTTGIWEICTPPVWHKISCSRYCVSCQGRKRRAASACPPNEAALLTAASRWRMFFPLRYSSKLK